MNINPSPTSWTLQRASCSPAETPSCIPSFPLLPDLVFSSQTGPPTVLSLLRACSRHPGPTASFLWHPPDCRVSICKSFGALGSEPFVVQMGANRYPARWVKCGPFVGSQFIIRPPGTQPPNAFKSAPQVVARRNGWRRRPLEGARAPQPRWVGGAWGGARRRRSLVCRTGPVPPTATRPGTGRPSRLR